MIIHTDVEASLRLRCANLLLTALDNCRDVVQVTDGQDRVIYENNSTEKVLGYSSSDWLEKSLWDYQVKVLTNQKATLDQQPFIERLI